MICSFFWASSAMSMARKENPHINQLTTLAFIDFLRNLAIKGFGFVGNRCCGLFVNRICFIGIELADASLVLLK